MTVRITNPAQQQLHETGYIDRHGRSVEYLTTIDPVCREGETTPRAWRVYGQQLRGGVKHGRPSSPRTVYIFPDAMAMARTVFAKHLRYLERNHARSHLRAVSAEEDLAALGARL